MITEAHYWIFLAIAFAVVSLVPVRIRLQCIGLLSFVCLFFLLASVAPDADMTSETHSLHLYKQNYYVIYWLTFWTFVFFYVPKIAALKKLPGSSLNMLLIGAIVSYLFYSKYIPEIVRTVAGATPDTRTLIPLGVSYFSFKLIHYLIENSRGRFQPHGFFQFWTYIFLFPIYTAGPIERFDNFQRNCLSTDRRTDIIEGLTRIIYGLIKKFVISGVLLVGLLSSHTGDSVLSDLETIAHYKVWGFLLLNYLIIYLDFSAYSDIAIGSSRLLGIRIGENFNWPILATNITILWKRWHMSLGNWCQSYIYMPAIGFSRNPYFAIFLTFLAIGLWHGGNYTWVAWGLYQGIGVVTYRIWSKSTAGKYLADKRSWITNSLAIAMTNIWMAGSFAFTATYHTGSISDVRDAFFILGKCLFLI
ncbi:hypothetical protein AB833_07740 [Chromatiales bacterium (ex Bugula neritina AB1)]|nr:hypothetical protein AB833_07740 [Chromatiales bacterium (ex Bugula neritina AB1)]